MSHPIFERLLPMDVMTFFQEQPVEPADRTRRIHRRYALQAALEDLLPATPAARCLTKPVLGGVPYILQRPDGSRVYSGVYRCGNSWSCTHCATSLSEVRRREVEVAIREWRGERYGADQYPPSEYYRLSGKEIRMILFTVPHQRYEDLEPLLERFLGAFRWMRKNRSYRVFCKELNLFGTIYILEVTYGANGWHPHIHMLCFFDSSRVINIRLREEFFSAWFEATAKYGFPPLSLWGFGIKDADFASTYLTKFGYSSEEEWLVSHELSKWFLKKGSQGGLTPFDLLEGHLSSMYFGEECGMVQGRAAGDLFKEYVNAFRGRHQMQWSKGLKRYFGLREVSDEEAVNQMDQLLEEGCTIQPLSLEHWRELVKRGSRYSYLAGLN